MIYLLIAGALGAFWSGLVLVAGGSGALAGAVFAGATLIAWCALGVVVGGARPKTPRQKDE